MKFAGTQGNALWLVLFAFATAFISAPVHAEWNVSNNGPFPTPRAACQDYINKFYPTDSTYVTTITKPGPGDPNYGYYLCSVQRTVIATGVVTNPYGVLGSYPGCNPGYYASLDAPSGCVPYNISTDPRFFGCPSCGDQMGIAKIGDPTSVQYANNTNMSGAAGPSEPNRLKFAKSLRNTAGPADSQTGNGYYEETDYTSAGPNRLTFTRYYNSQDNHLHITSFGGGWRHTFDRYFVVPGTAAKSGILEREDGKKYGVTANGTNYYIPGENNFTINRVTVGSVSTYTVTLPDDTVEVYTANSYAAGTVANLQSITSRNGYSITLDRSVANTLKATDSYGRVLTLNFNATSHLLTSITTPDSTTINYGYTTDYYAAAFLGDGTSAAGSRLASVTYPDAPSNPVTYGYAGTTSSSGTVMTYASTTYPVSAYMLTSVTDQLGHVKNSWTVDPWGRVTSLSGYNGLDTTTIAYNDSAGTRTVTTPSGVVETYSFTSAGGLPRVTGVDRAATSTTPADTGGAAFDSNGYLYVRGTRYIPPYSTNNRRDVYTNNGRGQPTQVVEATDQSSIKRTTTITYQTVAAPSPYPSGYVFHAPLTISEGIVGTSAPLRTTTFTYDTHGNVLTKTVHDGTAAAQPDRVWTYTYDSTGNVLTAQDPMGNTTTFTYTNGALATVTDALSHTTTFSNFTSGGRPQTITDPNGTVYTITYDSRQRVATTSITVGGVARTTTYAYRANGELLSATYPDSTSLTRDYAFETAGASPLTYTETDAAGNKATTTLNADNKPTKVQTLDSTSVVALHRNKTYDALGRVLTETDSTGTKVTTYSYDVNGNLLTMKDGNNHTTTYTYDYLNRRLTATDANSGVTTYNYNALNQVTSIVAPGSRTTTYTYDAFGDVMSEVSPDRGTTTYAYDKNSNLTSKTDGASAVTNYSYDALNRPLTVTYPADSTLNVTNTYDQTGHGKGIGHLTSVTDAAGSLSLSYDERGNVTARNRTTPSGNLDLSATYNAAGKPASITYPSGLVVSYTRDTAGNIATVTATPSGGSATTIANYSSGYLPFGPAKAVALGNGVTTTYAYDHDLLLTGITDNSSLQSLAYGYDNADNLTSITDSITAANTQTLGYDVINRLTSASSGSGGYGSLSYSYDSNSNRLTSVVNGTSTSYTYTANTNRLATLGGVSVSTTGAGNISGATIGGTAYTYAYNKANRLATVTTSAGTTTNTYDAFGTRVIKTVGSTPTIYATGSSNQLLEEKTGSTATDYIYVNGQPIAQVTGTTITYLHADQRGTPVLATNGSRVVQWRTTYDPFGKTGTITGSLTQNVRLPGQIADIPNVLSQNGQRDYVPELARYLESDPIGLVAGTNTYGYVDANPFGGIDPWGLAELCVRPLLVPIPYARHCFIKLDDGNTLSYDPKGAHADPNPTDKNAVCTAMDGMPSDKCLTEEMQKCNGKDYNFTGNNCCHCAENAMKACAQSVPQSAWPNWPINPGPQQGEAGYKEPDLNPAATPIVPKPLIIDKK